MGIDVVWLKRDVRLHDHGPLAEACFNSSRPFVILYLYEPDQLKEHCVHGSHIHVINEGLQELEKRIGKSNSESFEKLTVCYANAVETFQEIHDRHGGIARILAHQETGHMASYQRDRAVRRWCKQHNIKCVEMQHMGVTRRLKNRDDFSKNLAKYMSLPLHPTPTKEHFRRLIRPDLKGRLDSVLSPVDINEIEHEHRVDRKNRQRGGEIQALTTLDSFLTRRVPGYSAGISSPNSSWSSCSRLSIYLAWGHLSLRKVIHSVRARQVEVKALPESQRPPGALKSLSAFLSRLHWRSHFIQKLEDDPHIELVDMCPAFQPLRRGPNDFNIEHYQAWATGKTGFPFVDACMRCLHEHGWLNFRMRAMVISFACYNLWLDWRRIAPHMARLFLDYEPGIHYPQLQMQAGTTGINAMRVYSVTKQGKDQDPEGKFVRRYVPELTNVPKEFIQEPWRMSINQQMTCGVMLGQDYPERIVDEQQTAREAKARLSEVRKMSSTRDMAAKVYEKHGSRTGNRDDDKNLKKRARDTNQPSIKGMFQVRGEESEASGLSVSMQSKKQKEDKKQKQTRMAGQQSIKGMFQAQGEPRTSRSEVPATTTSTSSSSWNCTACTFLNENKPFALACEVCGTPKDP